MPVSSLESIHDNIHVRVGMGGHMNDPSVAGRLFLMTCKADSSSDIQVGKHSILSFTCTTAKSTVCCLCGVQSIQVSGSHPIVASMQILVNSALM
jgi:hypothetical protein